MDHPRLFFEKLVGGAMSKDHWKVPALSVSRETVCFGGSPVLKATSLGFNVSKVVVP